MAQQTPAISCPSASFCSYFAEYGKSPDGRNNAGTGAFYVSASPSDPGSWRQRAFPRMPRFNTEGIICASQTLCLAFSESYDQSIGKDSPVLTVQVLRDPLSASSHWQSYNLKVNGSTNVKALGVSASCTAGGACLLIAQPWRHEHGQTPNAYFMASDNVAGGASTWNQVEPPAAFTPSQPGVSLSGLVCFGNGAVCHVNETGGIKGTRRHAVYLLASSDAFDPEPPKWVPTVEPGVLADGYPPSCPTASLCYAIGGANGSRLESVHPL
ncbi:MAG TPA: hypothetical protein VHV75_06580 [Solirubrobacteraceae bacterium]|nr:hypothetical protein [Solirubrobacteraceae bacterium]